MLSTTGKNVLLVLAAAALVTVGSCELTSWQDPETHERRVGERF